MTRRDRSRMPLPGEHPIHVYGHKKARRKVKPKYGFIRNFGPPLLFVAGIVLLAWFWMTLRIPVTLVVNGQPVDVRTHRRTVSGALLAAGYDPTQVVFSDPDLTQAINRNMVITAAIVRPVIVYADGERITVTTQATDPAAIVAEAGLAFGLGDQITVSRYAAPTAAEIDANPELGSIPAVPREITIERGRTLIVSETLPDGTMNRVSLTTGASTLGPALLDAGYELFAADEVNVPLDAPVVPGMEVTIERSLPVTIIADGLTMQHHTQETIVADILAENGLAPLTDDYTIPQMQTTVAPGEVIQLVRVTYELIEQREPIPFDVRYIPDPEMNLDQLVEVRPGGAGTRVVQTRVRYEDGQVVARLPAGSWVEAYPQAQVIAYGTNIVLRTQTTVDGQITYWRKLRMLATSYSPLTAGEKQPGDPFFGLSATGAEVVRGIVATDPRVVPLGTSVYVPNYGTGLALDIGGAVKGMRIDLGYDDANLVLWNNWTDVYLTPPVPPPDQIVWVLPEIAEIDGIPADRP